MIFSDRVKKRLRKHRRFMDRVYEASRTHEPIMGTLDDIRQMRKGIRRYEKAIAKHNRRVRRELQKVG